MRRLMACTIFATAMAFVVCGKKQEPVPVAPAPEPAPAVAATPAPAPLAVGSVTLGTAVGSDKKIMSPAETFGVKDKIFASVESTGAGHAKLRALWSYIKDGKTTKVNETEMEFDASGPAWNEFHIENAKDWPEGDYQVEIFLGDGATPVATHAFRVQ